MDLFDFALYLALNKGGGGGGAPIDDNTISPSKTWSSQKIDNTKANKAPHNYAFDGVDLSTIFADADELYAAYSQEDYGKIHIGDYWRNAQRNFQGLWHDDVPAGTDVLQRYGVDYCGGNG